MRSIYLRAVLISLPSLPTGLQTRFPPSPSETLLLRPPASTRLLSKSMVQAVSTSIRAISPGKMLIPPIPTAISSPSSSEPTHFSSVPISPPLKKIRKRPSTSRDSFPSPLLAQCLLTILSLTFSWATLPGTLKTPLSSTTTTVTKSLSPSSKTTGASPGNSPSTSGSAGASTAVTRKTTQRNLAFPLPLITPTQPRLSSITTILRTANC